MTEQQQRQLQIFSLALLNSSNEIDPEVRRSAAQELIMMDVPQATAVLDQALRSGRASVMMAAISAMQSAPAAPPELLDAAIAAIPTAPSSVIESLSWNIARYGPAALKHVAQQAMDRQAAAGARINAIRAMSAFDSQDAAATLMQLINRTEESAEIVQASCDGLQRLSGLAYGGDLNQWRTWWREAQALPPGQWSAFIAKSLSRRAAQLQQELQKQKEVTDRISRDLYAAYRDLYPALPVDEQLRRLPALLQDQLPAVREFALSRLALLLRDSVRIPADLQMKMAERINDEVPALRVQAARLLDELNHESLGEILANRLAQENSPTALGAFCELLAKRPHLAAMEPATRWLLDPELGDRAAHVLWRVLETQPVEAQRRDALVDQVRRAAIQRRSPAAFRLLAWIGDEQDATELMHALDHEDAALRTAVSEGFFQRGLRQPLIDRASDPAIFLSALRAIGEEPATLQTYRTLVSWQPPQIETHAKSWHDAVVKVSNQLDPSSLLAADDLLSAAAHAPPTLRYHVLARVVSLKQDELHRDQRAKAVARFVPLLINQGEASRAYALLEGMNCDTPEFRSVCFEAAALAGHYERANQVQNQPAAWVQLLTRVAERDVLAAGPLCTEITRRFAGRLSDEDQKLLEQISHAAREAGASMSATTTQRESAFR